MFRGSVKSTGYQLHSPVSPSLPLPCVTVCQHISAGVYLLDVNVSESLASSFCMAEEWAMREKDVGPGTWECEHTGEGRCHGEMKSSNKHF